MGTILVLIGAVALFACGLRLSAFFSGAETGFYRISHLRLSIDTQAGDRVAKRIMWFTRNPSYFVATTLVGNNVANYLTTVAIGLGAVAVFRSDSGWAEIVGTLLLAPVVFVFGELVPKNLSYRAPMKLLRRDVGWFTFSYRLFLIVSFPLIWITKLFERFGNSDERQFDLLLGRSGLVQLLGQGHREGLLTEVQSRLITGLMQTAAEPVSKAMTPRSRVIGVADDAGSEDVLECAERFGLTHVAVRSAGADDAWYGYVHIGDLVVDQQPFKSAIRRMPQLPASARKLEALLELRTSGMAYGAIMEEGHVVGTVSEQGLVEQLFRHPSMIKPV
jgi:CBS domain containing-hemolysin-like protein